MNRTNYTVAVHSFYWRTRILLEFDLAPAWTSVLWLMRPGYPTGLKVQKRPSRAPSVIVSSAHTAYIFQLLRRVLPFERGWRPKGVYLFYYAGPSRYALKNVKNAPKERQT